uniref:Uncharacterized protein n=1 Tax=Heterorhabditis bacteriophora TaxID=37862 RepID=A0A1I7XN10_HETBA
MPRGASMTASREEMSTRPKWHQLLFEALIDFSQLHPLSISMCYYWPQASVATLGTATLMPRGASMTASREEMSTRPKWHQLLFEALIDFSQLHPLSISMCY